MTILDRYLFGLFAKIFAICFVSLTGLYIVIHLFTNLDELTEISRQVGGMPRLIVDFYGPRILDLLDRMAGILILIAAIFSFTWMQRRREMTAIESAGISKSRMFRPVLMGACMLVAASVASRELVVPHFKRQLLRTPQNWMTGGSVPMTFQKDALSGVLVRGDKLLIDQRIITEPDIQLPLDVDHNVSRIRAAVARAIAADHQHPAGLLLTDIAQPPDLPKGQTLTSGGRPLVLTPGEHAWLKPNECFVCCDLDLEQIAFGQQASRYQALPELIAAVRRPSLWFGRSQQVAIHSRIVQPILELALLLLGMPLIVSKTDLNLFVAAAWCLLIVGGFQTTVLAAQTLGSMNMLRPAALAAWLPVVIFVPLAAVSMRRMNN